MTIYERMARWSKLLAVFLVTLLAVGGCNREVSKNTRDREHSIADGTATETLGDPWAEGEDCRNWGCAEKSTASQSAVAPAGNATTCTSPGQCPSGFCVDGVCCDKACTGTCLACTAAKKGSGVDGVCGAIALYGDPDNECPDAACSGAGTCQSYNGVVCSAGAQCLSGNCADGYCCGGACTETCRACSKAKTGGAYNGQCLSIPTGTDPDNECAFGDCNGSAACTTPVNQPNGVACTAAGQCASGYCVDGVCCGAACTETCRACTVAKRGGGYDGQCGPIAMGTDPDNECVNGECNGSAACTTPIGQSNGSACSSSVQCTSGFCGDGVCCDKACTGTCEACTATKKGSGSNGVCGFIAANTNPDNECVGGKCGGAGTCKYYNGIACASTSSCLSGYCVDGVCCGGACTGTCQACSVAKKGGGIEGQCGNIVTGTDPDAECASDCNGSGACVTLLANGSACTVGTLCTSGFCVDGVCCDKACSGTCEACTATKKGSGSNGVCGFVAADTNPDNECVGGKCGGSGTCKSYNGLACAAPSSCLSGYCVDGVCCGNACTGTCQACSVAKKGGGIEGQCANIATGTDPDSECGGDCNGAGACTLGGIGASCNGGAQCSSGFCVDGVCCNSACTGTCQACTAAKKGSGTNGTCGNIAAASDPDNECPNNDCDGAGACAKTPIGSACSTDAQCGSGHCADGYCCNTSCTATCMACNVVGSEGTCIDVPFGQTDSNGAPPCSDVCDGQGVCNLNAGSACTSGSQCGSHVCDDGACAAVTAPGPLAWMTILSDMPNYGAYVDLETISTHTLGGVSAAGVKQGHLNLGGVALDVCCWLASVGFSFDGAGFPTSIGDGWMNDYNYTYTHGYAPMRFDNASTTRRSWHSGPAYSNEILVSGRGWSRSFYQTNVSLNAGEGGHVLIGATISPDDQNTLNPVDFGDGNLVTNSRLVKYGPTGQVVFNVPLGTLQLGSVIDPNGNFYAFSRPSGTISITKQDGMGGALWTKNYVASVASGATPALAYAFDTSGNVLIAFNFNGTANLGNGDMASTGIHDLGLAKLDPNGNALWSKHFGTPTFDLQTVTLHPTGAAELALMGSFVGTADFGQGSFTESPVLAKFDATGALVWRVPAPTGTFKVRGNSVGAVFITSSSETVDFGWGPPLAGEAGIVMAKYGPCADPANCRPVGSTCSINNECDSGFCADGVCCDQACSGTCQACTAAKKGSGANGICGPIANATDPDDECANSSCSGTGVCAQYNGANCSSAAECLSGYCVDGYCCGGECVGPCLACSAAKKGGGANGGCGPIAVGTDPDAECGSGMCSGATGCSMASVGITCTANNQCASGNCVDGVCCNTACTATCQACSAAKKGSGVDGQCGNVVVYKDPDNECSYGTCNGSGACIAGALGLPCAGSNDCAFSAYCVEGICCNTSCAGTCQACSAAKKGSGADGTCGNIAHDTDPDNECTGGKCGGNGTCQVEIGTTCAITADCLSGHCIDGVCCDSACSGLCQACSVVKKGSGFDGICENIAGGTDPDNDCALECNGSGACVPAGNGAACATAAQCSSGNCVDGYCCDTVCAGTCMACSTAKKGMGSNGQCGVISAGSDPDNECAGTCNGMGSCAAPPVLLANGTQCNASVQCTSGYCIDGVCCNTSCYETCKACNLPGTQGTCSETSPGACAVCSGILALPTMPNTRPKGSKVATADLNGDGFIDVLTTVYSSNNVRVLLGNGNGTFSPNGDYATGAGSIAVALADVNGDGTIDAVVANQSDVNVSVLLNLGDGTFVSGGNYAVGGAPNGIALADIDGDGIIDIAAANYGSSPNFPQSVSVLLGDGLGAFATKVDSVFPGVYPRSIAAADFTGDGMADLVVTYTVSGTAYASVLRSVGNGNVQFMADYTLTNANQFEDSYGAHAPAATDMNGDGVPDLVIATDISSSYGKLIVLMNQGNGTFVDQYHSLMEGTPGAINTGDLNGDGLVDVTIAGAGNAYGATVFLNNGAGAYAKTLYRGTYLENVGIDDLNGDGALDLVGGMGYGITVLLNQGSGTFLDDASTSEVIEMADLDGNGTLDAVVQRSGYNDNVVSVHLNQGGGTFASRVDVATSTSSLQFFDVADLNGDGKPDLVITNPTLNTVSVRLNNGNGTFGAATQYAVVGNPSDLMAADVTGDGKPDIVLAYYFGSSISVLRNNGNGTFAAKADYPTSQAPSKIVAADMNDDGMTDIVIGSNYNAKIEVAINQGNGTFAVSNFGIGYADFAVADMNGDGKPDFLTTNASNAISLRLNQGSGTFANEVLYPVAGMSYVSLFVQDMDGNGTPDLRTMAGFPARTAILINPGPGTFGKQIDYPTPCNTFADINGDGLLDGIRADATTVFVKYGECLP